MIEFSFVFLAPAAQQGLCGMLMTVKIFHIAFDRVLLNRGIKMYAAKLHTLCVAVWVRRIDAICNATQVGIDFNVCVCVFLFVPFLFFIFFLLSVNLNLKGIPLAAESHTHGTSCCEVARSAQ